MALPAAFRLLATLGVLDLGDLTAVVRRSGTGSRADDPDGRTADIGMQALELVHQSLFEQEVQGTVDGRAAQGS